MTPSEEPRPEMDLGAAAPLPDGRRYPISIGRRAATLLRLVFGVTRENALVALTDDELTARFGRWDLCVPVESVVRWQIEGPWRAITAVGVRRSLRHGDVTFAGSAHGGVRLDFAEPVRWGRFSVPALYVGVEDPEALATDLVALGIPGQDIRQR